jgi:hypothetical protein
MIVRNLTRHVEYIDFLIIRRRASQSKYYECYVKRSRAINALLYKIQMDKFYQDVQIDMEFVVALCKNPTYVSPRIKLLIVILKKHIKFLLTFKGFPMTVCTIILYILFLSYPINLEKWKI